MIKINPFYYSNLSFNQRYAVAALWDYSMIFEIWTAPVPPTVLSPDTGTLLGSTFFIRDNQLIVDDGGVWGKNRFLPGVVIPVTADGTIAYGRIRKSSGFQRLLFDFGLPGSDAFLTGSSLDVVTGEQVSIDGFVYSFEDCE